jgi:hypothetical protein
VYCLNNSNDRGSTYLWNIGLFQRDYTSIYHTRLSSSYSSPWEPEMLHFIFYIKFIIKRNIFNNFNTFKEIIRFRPSQICSYRIMQWL